MQMNRTCMLGDLKKNMYHDRESITIAVPYPFSNLKKLSGFSIQYLHEEGPWGTWNIVLFGIRVENTVHITCVLNAYSTRIRQVQKRGR